MRYHTLRLRISLVLIILCFGAALAPAALIHGPYLIYPGHNSEMLALWQFDTPSSCTLEWGPDANCQAGSATPAEINADHQYQYRFTGLTPGQRVYYRLKEGANTYPASFLAPPPADTTRLKFLVYGDTRNNISADDSVCAAMKADYGADPSAQTFLLQVGDWVGLDTAAAWGYEYFNREPYAANMRAVMANVPIQGCIGNHEGGGVFYKKFWPYPYVDPARFYWSFDYGPAHIAVIDQYDQPNGPSDAQIKWLQDDLARSTKEWKFLLFHEPAWTVANKYHPSNIRAQQVLQPLCLKYGIDLCFGGHVHLYAHCVQDGVHHLTFGGGGAPLYTPESNQPANVIKTVTTFHYAKIEIDGKNLRCTVRQPDGKVIDDFTVTHATSASAWPLKAQSTPRGRYLGPSSK